MAVSQRRTARSWFTLALAFVIVASIMSVFASLAVDRSYNEQSRRAFVANSADIASTLQLAIQPVR
jgi:cbb3-type cytochrome oxidase subunit 3